MYERDCAWVSRWVPACCFQGNPACFLVALRVCSFLGAHRSAAPLPPCLRPPTVRLAVPECRPPLPLCDCRMDLQAQCADEMSYASDALGIDPGAATSPGAVQVRGLHGVCVLKKHVCVCMGVGAAGGGAGGGGAGPLVGPACRVWNSCAQLVGQAAIA